MILALGYAKCRSARAIPALTWEKTMKSKPRLAARAMLIDPESRLLLLKGRDSTLPDSQHWWFTVGGGINKKETPEDALRREVLEETGLLVSPFHKTPFSRTFSLTFEGRLHLQHESYFFAQVHSFTPVSLSFTPIEKRSLIGHRWWSLEELKQTQEAIHPRQLWAWLEYLLKSHSVH